MNNKPRKSWIAGILAFLVTGLGHIYAGNAKRGLVLYAVLCTLSVLLPQILVLKPNIYILATVILIVIAVSFYAIADAVRIARKNSTSYAPKKYNKWYVYLAFFLITALIVQPNIMSFIKKYSLKAYRIPAGSMIPTLLVGDHLLANQFKYELNRLKRGDMIVFEFPENPSVDFIKRIVGLEGDQLEVKNNKVFINGVEQIENYIFKDQLNTSSGSGKNADYGPVVVPANSFFVMGDNRENSYDSRFWGFVSKERVKGKAVLIYWSWDKDISKVRWDRIGKAF